MKRAITEEWRRRTPGGRCTSLTACRGSWRSSSLVVPSTRPPGRPCCWPAHLSSSSGSGEQSILYSNTNKFCFLPKDEGAVHILIGSRYTRVQVQGTADVRTNLLDVKNEEYNKILAQTFGIVLPFTLDIETINKSIKVT